MSCLTLHFRTVMVAIFVFLFQSMFSQGNVVILESCASGKLLRISDVQDTGGRGQFRVHVRLPE